MYEDQGFLPTRCYGFPASAVDEVDLCEVVLGYIPIFHT